MPDAPPPVGSVPVRDAATVMIVRDALDGPGVEVFMLRRNLQSDFVGGAYVFPGGGVDHHDRSSDLEAVCWGRSDADASAQLGLDAGGLAYWVAAIRESFEEAGILLARDATGAIVDFGDPETDARFRSYRAEVDAGERRLVDVCRAEGLHLAADGLHYFGRWVTPEGRTRRYDTRFFVAAEPPGQVPLHDDREVIANLWVRPADAITRYEAGTYELRPPTLRMLVALDRFPSAAAVLAAGRAAEGRHRNRAEFVEMPGRGSRILLPGDAGYDEAIATAPAEGTLHTSTDSAKPAPDTALSCVARTGGDRA